MAHLNATEVIDAIGRDERLRPYLREGRVDTLPAKRSRRLLLLDHVAQAFELGVHYPEREVNLLLGAIHADFAALRRHLVDEQYLSRADGEYWRSGGSVTV